MRELSLHILDVVQNSFDAGATQIELFVDENSADDRLTITVRDNGRGMSEDQLARVSDPFFTSRNTRHVGLGIPLFQAAAERCDGSLTVRSQIGTGTTLKATFRHSHLDRAPLGDMCATLLAIILSGSSDVHYIHRIDGRDFGFRTEDLRAALGTVPLIHPAARQWLRDFITEGEAELSRHLSET